MTLGAAQRDLLDDLFAAIDRKDTGQFLTFLTSDAEFRFGSAPAAGGRDAVREAVDGFFASIAGLEHKVTNAISDGDTLFCEGEVTYTRHNDTSITLPFADVFEFEDGLISQYKIYMDISPLYAT